MRDSEDKDKGERGKVHGTGWGGTTGRQQTQTKAKMRRYNRSMIGSRYIPYCLAPPSPSAALSQDTGTYTLRLPHSPHYYRSIK